MLILASNSAARRAMLQAAGVAFEAVAADIDEAGLRDGWRGLPAAEVALGLAAAKAVAVSGRHPGKTVLGSDSIVETEEGLFLDKPGTMAGLRAQLLQLRGRTHRLLSAAAFARDGQTVWRHVGEARLSVRDFSDSFLSCYLHRCGAELLQSVGGYHVEAMGVQLFDRIEGSEFVIRGLPLVAVLGFLREAGEVPA